MPESVGCNVEGCPSAHYGKGFCSKHYQRWRKHGDPEAVLPRRQPGPRPETYVEAPTYRALHSRLANERGGASQHPCHDCGSPAEEWSYDGGDPEPLMGTTGGWGQRREVVYSTNLDLYVPRCRGCHRVSEKRSAA